MSPIPRTWINFKWDDRHALEEIARLVADLDAVSPMAIDEWGEVLVESIRSFTPRVTGERQASIGKYDPSLIVGSADPQAHVRARANAIYRMRRSKADTWELVVGTNSDVVVYLNYGTRRIKPLYMFERGQAAALPYLRPTVQKALEMTVARRNKTQGRLTAAQKFNPGITGSGYAGRIMDQRRRVRMTPA